MGLTKFTNEAGALFLADAFPEFPCSPVKVGSSGGALSDKHLSHYVAMASAEVISVGACKTSQEIIKRIEAQATYNYEKITMPGLEHPPLLMSVNGSLIHRQGEEKVYQDKLKIMVKRITELEEMRTKLNVNFHRLVVLLNKARIKSFV